MSPLLRSELHLRLGPRHAQARLWRAGWRPRCVAAHVQSGTTALASVLEALATGAQPLPARARVCLEDEHLYYLLWPATGAWSEVRSQAGERLAELTGEAGLTLGAALTPGGRHWLVVGAPVAVVQALEADLAAHGIALTSLTAALPDDLLALGDQLPEDGLVVLPRREGVMLVDLAGADLVGVTWQRGDFAAPGALSRRIDGQLARREAPVDTPVLIATDGPEHLPLLAPQAAAQGWRLQPLERAAVLRPEAA